MINYDFRRSIQSAFDGGGSGHSLKMSSSLIGKYGGHPSQYSSDISHLETHCTPDFRSNSSPQGLSSEKPTTLTSSNNDGAVEDNCFASKDNNDAMNESTNDLSHIAKLVPNANEEIRVGSKSLFDQMEDAVAKAKFIAAQQFLLQNFHKQRQALMNAASLQNTTIPLEEKKRSLSQFPFTPFPFNIPQPSPMIGHPPFPSFSPFHNVKTESSEGEVTERKEKDNPGDPVETRMNGADPNPTENALLLFSQIQNYRRHLLDSGIAKFPSIASLDQNSLRQCDQLIAPF